MKRLPARIPRSTYGRCSEFRNSP